MQSCIEECLHCHRVCVEMTAHCLEKGGRHAAAGHIRVLMDCAQICATSADFMLRGSPLHMNTCAACAIVCEACAQSCDQFADDEVMKRCADVCRRCAASCREMSGTRRAA
jgi:hypothetical protein